jgi:outer membrane lipopolysaccharide assembly protein LptE/RlpB
MRAPRRAFLLAAAALLTACGYHLTGHNTSLPPTVKRIGIPPFVNKTDRPDIEQRITGFVISQFLTRGRYQILPNEEGVDAILRGEITTFVQTPVTISPQGRATRYEILINARATLVQAADDKILWQDDHFVFRRQYDVSNQVEGAITEETVALDQVCSDFSESVVTSILEGF